MFCYWLRQLALAIDALSIQWESMEAYAFPLITLIPKVLQHMKRFQCKLILIAPPWPRRSWYTDLLQMLIDFSKEATNTAEHALPAGNQDLPSSSSSVPSSCMVAINRSFENKGFSEQSRKLLAASWRSGTQKDYTAKFRKFDSWCSERKIDPYKATLKECVDFLTFLFQSRLKYRTIAGYRSMLSAFLRPVDNVSVGQHPDVVRLLKIVFN